MPGKGKMQITGKLGDVMQESVKAAKSYIRSKSLDFGIVPPTFDKKDFHIHVPEGATPKDGPSAGIGMLTSIVSAITENPVDKNVAMTGEITLRGLVLPIGGLKEKLLAAHRAGIKKVVIPMENKKDLIEVPKTVLDNMEIIPVKNVDEVLKVALTKPLKRVEWVEIDNVKKTKEDKAEVTSRH
jgi:ATP-dependent Lon protease